MQPIAVEVLPHQHGAHYSHMEIPIALYKSLTFSAFLHQGAA
jgi:hypothetical protein